MVTLVHLKLVQATTDLVETVLVATIVLVKQTPLIVEYFFGDFDFIFSTKVCKFDKVDLPKPFCLSFEFLSVLATTALRASAARSGSEVIRQFKIRL